MPSSLSRRDVLKKLGVFTSAAALPLSSWATNDAGEPILLPDLKLTPAPSQPVTAITCGAGNRGNVYGNFAYEYPDMLDIVIYVMNAMQQNIR
jgi:hypothetical protein